MNLITMGEVARRLLLGAGRAARERASRVVARAERATGERLTHRAGDRGWRLVRWDRFAEVSGLMPRRSQVSTALDQLEERLNDRIDVALTKKAREGA